DSTDDWPSYGHDPGGMRYSPLTQINRERTGLSTAASLHGSIPRGQLPSPAVADCLKLPSTPASLRSMRLPARPVPTSAKLVKSAYAMSPAFARAGIT